MFSRRTTSLGRNAMFRTSLSSVKSCHCSLQSTSYMTSLTCKDRASSVACSRNSSTRVFSLCDNPCRRNQAWTSHSQNMNAKHCIALKFQKIRWNHDEKHLADCVETSEKLFSPPHAWSRPEMSLFSRFSPHVVLSPLPNEQCACGRSIKTTDPFDKNFYKVLWIWRRNQLDQILKLLPASLSFGLRSLMANIEHKQT